MSSGTAGSAGFGAGAGSDFVSGALLPQPDRKTRPTAYSAASCRDLRKGPPDATTLRYGCWRLVHQVKDGMAAVMLAARWDRPAVVVLCVGSFIRDLAPPG